MMLMAWELPGSFSASLRLQALPSGACIAALSPGSQEGMHVQVFWHTTHQGIAMQLAREAGAQISDDALALGVTHVIAEV